MKIKLTALLAGFVGIGMSLSVAAQESSVPVVVSGTIAAAPFTGCSTDGASDLEFAFEGSYEDWVVQEDGRSRFNDVPTGSVTIDCADATGTTDISFATNDGNSRSNPQNGCTNGVCTSYAVVFQPTDLTACDQSCLENLQEGQITVNLANATCTNEANCDVTTGVFGNASITADQAEVVTATFSGTLFTMANAGATPEGDIKPSPRSQEQALYVIYGANEG